MDGETVAEQQTVALAQIRGDVLFIHRGDFQIRYGHKDDIRPANCLGRGENLEAMLFCDGDRLAAFVQADVDADSAVLEVERVCMPLGAETDHGHLSFFQGVEAGVRVVIDAGGHGGDLLWVW